MQAQFTEHGRAAVGAKRVSDHLPAFYGNIVIACTTQFRLLAVVVDCSVFELLKDRLYW